MNPRGQKEDSGLHSHSKITEKYNHEFLVFDLSQEELTLGGRGNERMGREVGVAWAAILYLTGYFTFP
jgi:hypothetical protein